MKRDATGWPLFEDHVGREKPWSADRFIVTGDHVKLLRRLNIGYDQWTEWGAPEVDPKRPYGNSDLYGDMREILGRPCVVIEGEESDHDELMKLHREMETVLQILVYVGSIEPGEYESPKYFAEWRRRVDGGQRA